ncbi:NAD(P)/FAD-dependent oxidoreductase, partial [Streptomyces sp. NPDC006129]
MSGRIVVAGASLGGLRAAEQLRAAGWTGGITVVGDEPHPPYNR